MAFLFLMQRRDKDTIRDGLLYPRLKVKHLGVSKKV